MRARLSVYETPGVPRSQRLHGWDIGGGQPWSVIDVPLLTDIPRRQELAESGRTGDLDLGTAAHVVTVDELLSSPAATPVARSLPSGGTPKYGRVLRGGSTALAWLYVYSVIWLGTYAVLAVLVFGWKPVIITGGSMEPSIKLGDVILVGKVDKPVGRGTVLTFKSRTGQGLVTHRVREAQLDGYRTRGDANGVDDSDLVPRSEVVGAGHLLIPLLGRPMVWLQSGQLGHLLGWLLASLAAIFLVTRRVKDDEPGAAVGLLVPTAPATSPARTDGHVPARDVLPAAPPRRRLRGSYA